MTESKVSSTKEQKTPQLPPRILSLALHSSLQGASPGCFSSLPFQGNKWTSWTACDICMTAARAPEQSEQPKSKEFARSKKQFVTKPSEDPHLAGVTTSIIIKSVTTGKPCHFHCRLFLLISSSGIIPLLLGADLSLYVLQRTSPNSKEWEVLAEIISRVVSVKAKRQGK